MTNGVETLEEVMEVKKKFAELAETATLEVFKLEAAKYFDAKEKKYADAIDFAWGDQLMIAVEMQRRVKIRRERMEAATNTKEAYAMMFSPV